MASFPATVAAGSPNPTIITKRAPRRVYEGKSRQYLRDIEKGFNLVSECVGTMRKLCPLPESDFFFTAFKVYEKEVTVLIQDASRVLRKMVKPFHDTTYIDPVYEVGEKLLQCHRNFTIAYNHLNIKKGTIFTNTLLTLAEQLEKDFDKFVTRNMNKKNTQFAWIVSKCEPVIRDELHSCLATLKRITSPIEFDKLAVQHVIGLIDKYKTLNRTFEIELHSALKPIEPHLPAPDPAKTEWHRTFVHFVPLLSHAPLFNEQMERMNKFMPMISDSLNGLCSKMSKVAPIHDELAVFQDKITSFEPDKVDYILDRASKFLEVPRDPSKPKVAQLEGMLIRAEEIITELQDKIKSKAEEVKTIQKETKQNIITERMKNLRDEADKIAARYRNNMNLQIRVMADQLRSLVDDDGIPADEDPQRQFNILFMRLSREVNGLRTKQAHLENEIACNHPDMRNKLTRLCEKMNIPIERDDLSIEELADMACKGPPGNKSITEMCELLGEDTSGTIEALENRVISSIKVLTDENKKMKTILANTCNTITKKDISKYESKSVSDLCACTEKYVKKHLENTSSIDEIQTIKDELSKTEYTVHTIEPLTSIMRGLNSMADTTQKNYIPTSPEFSRYLDQVTAMKDVIHRINPNNVVKPVHALIVQSVELCNSLTIALSSSSFAPEYSENQKEVAGIISKYQSAMESVNKLRVLLEEKDALLSAETEKLRALEYSQYSDTEF